MTAIEKIFFSVMSGTQDRNVRFRDLQKLLETFGFGCRVKGDHFIYYKDGLPENINIQPNGKMAKPYQVKQVRNYLIKNHLKF